MGEGTISYLYKLVEDGILDREFADRQADRIRNQEPYSDPRWYIPPAATAIGTIQRTEDETSEAKEELHKILEMVGVLPSETDEN